MHEHPESDPRQLCRIEADASNRSRRVVPSFLNTTIRWLTVEALLQAVCFYAESDSICHLGERATPPGRSFVPELLLGTLEHLARHQRLQGASADGT